MNYHYERLLDEDELHSFSNLSSHAFYGRLKERPVRQVALVKGAGARRLSSTDRKRHTNTTEKNLSRNNKGLIHRWHVYRRVGEDRQSIHGRTKNHLVSNNNISSQGGDIHDNSAEVALVDLSIGDHLNGHDGIVHGGIVSLLFDEAMGCGYNVVQQSLNAANPQDGFTAMLKVNFRQPLLQNSQCVIRIFNNKAKSISGQRGGSGRKIFLDAELTSYDGSILYADAEALFIKNAKSKL
jgi:acyl-coenzyme A thioesterase PaaI-like protein